MQTPPLPTPQPEVTPVSVPPVKSLDMPPMPRGNSSRLMRTMMVLVAFGIGLMVASAVIVMMHPDLTQRADIMNQTIVQDLIAFIIPAVAVMAVLYYKPLDAMGLTRAPSMKALGVVVAVWLVSIPAMSWITELNASMTLPDALAPLEKMMREMEDQALEMTGTLLDMKNGWQLTQILLVVALMAGLSEEMLFRGALLTSMLDRRNPHIAVWVVAAIFSAIHFQFYGFVPRMLLGAWFGYLLVWTRSLWVPIVAHTLNNASAVLVEYFKQLTTMDVSWIDGENALFNSMSLSTIGSAVVTIAIIVGAYQKFWQKKALVRV